MGATEWKLAHKKMIFGLENQKKKQQNCDEITVSRTTCYLS
jgi:hypothetical protein